MWPHRCVVVRVTCLMCAHETCLSAQTNKSELPGPQRGSVRGKCSETYHTAPLDLTSACAVCACRRRLARGQRCVGRRRVLASSRQRAWPLAARRSSCPTTTTTTTSFLRCLHSPLHGAGRWRHSRRHQSAQRPPLMMKWSLLKTRGRCANTIRTATALALSTVLNSVTRS